MTKGWMRAAARLVAVLLLALSGQLAAAPAGATGPATAAPRAAAPNPGTDTVSWSVRPAPTASEPERPHWSFDVDPGAGVDDAVRIRNFGAGPLVFLIYASDAFTTRKGGLDLLPAGRRPHDVGRWVAMSAETIVVGPHAFLDVPFRLAVPDRASPGDHTGGIVTSLTTDAADAAGRPVRVDRRLGSRIYVRVGGPLRPALRVTTARAEYDGTLNPLGVGSARVAYTVRNVGNVRLHAQQHVRVRGPWGLLARTARFPDTPELLPGAAVRFVARVPSVWPTGRLDATITATPVPTRADDRIRSGPVAASTTASTWAMPWPFLALVVAGAAVTTVVLRRRRHRQRAVRDEVERSVRVALAERDTLPIPPSAVEAILAHMNEDHREDALVICRHLGGRPDATAARMVGLDGRDAIFAAAVGDAEVTLRVPWTAPITERARIREELVAMVEQSRQLGSPGPSRMPGGDDTVADG